MLKILRISTHPTVKTHGVGLHSFFISNTNLFETYFVAPSMNLKDSFLKSNKFKLINSNILFTKRPTQTSLINRIIFHIHRIFKLINLSMISVSEAKKYNVDIIHIHST